MGRLETGRWQPPVRIGLAQARVQQRQMLTDTQRMANAAGDYGQKERRFASVPIQLRFQRTNHPNSRVGQLGAKPAHRTRRKRGFPLIGELPPPSGSDTYWRGTPSAR
jgi:hypothetical protein